jgi:hypothetical protein
MIPFPEIEKIAEPRAPAVEQAAAWWWWAGAAMLGLIVVVLLIWGLASLFRRAALPSIPPSPEKVALRQLKALRKSASSLAPPDFGSELSGIIRAFLHRRMGMLARFATTEEILGTARRPDDAPPPPMTGAFSRVLEACDELKFSSGHAGSRAELLAATETAVREITGALRRRPAPSVLQSPPLPEVPHAPAS